MDYHDADVVIAKLARYNATATPRKDSIFVNPGGPGGEGIGLATGGSDSLQSFVRSTPSYSLAIEASANTADVGRWTGRRRI